MTVATLYWVYAQPSMQPKIRILVWARTLDIPGRSTLEAHI